jgi:N-succinyldiaminopimelate aminotransferase
VPARPNRLSEIPGFGIDRVAAAAGSDPEVLRLENLDTDLPPPPGVIEATRAAVGLDEFNSYLPFTGRDDLKAAVAAHLEERGGVAYDPATQVIITCGDGDNLNDALLATTDNGDEVIVTDPVYAGMINRVRLVGARPRVVPMYVSDGAWRLDLEALRAAVGERTRAVFLMNPSFPSGARLNDEEWSAVTALCVEHDLWLVYWSLYEGVVFDGAPIISPTRFPEMAERTIVCGTVSGEWRMIGWRVGWLGGPTEIVPDLALCHIYNGITPGGIGMAGALAALRAPAEDLGACVDEWQRRRDAVLEQLEGLPVTRADGGWSLLMDARELGIEPGELSLRLIEEKVAATPMTGWGGPVADRHIRFVFSNEPVERLELLGDRVRRALG